MTEKTITTKYDIIKRGILDQDIQTVADALEALEAISIYEQSLRAIREHLGHSVSAPPELMPIAWHIANNALEGKP
jgi:hypothetical protein